MHLTVLVDSAIPLIEFSTGFRQYCAQLEPENGFQDSKLISGRVDGIDAAVLTCPFIGILFTALLIL